MKTLMLNAVVLPTESVQQMAIQLSQGVRDYSGLTLNPHTALPHITLYQAAYPATAHNEVCGAFRTTVHGVQQFAFHITMGEIDPWGPDFLFWDVGSSGELQRLHERVVAALNPLRQGVISGSCQELLHRHRTPDVCRENDSIKKYGTPFAMETFRPHITLAHCAIEKNGQHALSLLLERLPPQSFRCKIETVALGKGGLYGTFPRVLRQYFLINPK